MHTRIACLLLFLMAVTTPASAQLRLPLLISDGMVMQRDMPVPVWGWASPGEKVTVTFDGKAYSATADAKGQFMVRLPKMPAGGPHEMTIAGQQDRRQIRDIWVGDVWVCSGQSNMEWTVANVKGAEAEIAAARDGKIRHFKVPTSFAYEPEPTLAGGEWQKADPQAVDQFTAVGYFFARSLREKMDVPIGLINTSWGGSRIEPWMSAAGLGYDAADLERIRKEEETRRQTVLEKLRAKIGELPEHDSGLVDGRALWADPNMNDAAWSRIAVPSLWEQAGYEDVDGIGWYRTTFDLTEQEARSGIRLGLGTIDDSDISYVNGQEIGSMKSAYSTVRVYQVPSSALRAGRNVIAVRVEDTGGGGGMYGDPNLLFVEVGGTRKPLSGEWAFRLGAVSVSSDGQRVNQLPTLLYNKMIYPLLPYPIKGFLWYQGESNANNVEEAAAYEKLFAGMIQQWRKDWGQPNAPFLWVQLTNFMAPSPEPTAKSNWPVLRDAQTSTLKLPATGQAVIIDIGEANDIHPRNKQDVGARLALAARKVAYGEDLVYSGPVYRSHVVRDGKVVVTFDHIGSGLRAKGNSDGLIKGFAIAGADKRFVWAEARIEKDRVVVWSDRVPNPVAIRYAWENNPDTANLYNAEQLPATPFRTDNW